MSDEQILIECVSLASSAVTRLDSSEKDPNENSLISDAVLATSETEKEKPSINGDVSRHATYKSDDTSDDGVFADADDDKPAGHVLGPVKVMPSSGTEDSHRIKLTEELLIEYAHLSDNELAAKITEHAIHNTSPKIDIEEDYLGVPRLEIGRVSDDDSDRDGYKTPVNSEQDDNPRGTVALDRTPEKRTLHDRSPRGRSPRERSLRERSPRGRSPRERSPRERSPREMFRMAYDGDVETDGDFNKLVIDTANAMNTFEFEDIKALFKGVEGFAIFIDQDSPILFLNHMRRYKVISPDNLQNLQTIVANLRNPLLHMRARQYIKQKAQTVYFYPETRHVPLGFGTFKCHVSGKDFTRLKRYDLESIRSTLSLLLFIPTCNIYIIGIEPGINLVISIMIPSRHIGALKKMVADGLPELGITGVDFIQISGRTYRTQGFVPHDATGKEHMKFLTVYQQLREKNLQLEERDREIATLKADAEFIRLELETKNAELGMLGEKSPRDQFRRHRSVERTRHPVRRGHSMPGIRFDRDPKPITMGGRQTTDIKIVISDGDSELQREGTRTGRTGLEMKSGSRDNKRERSGSRERRTVHSYKESHGFEWTRGDITVLSNARHIVEREEIMSEIESIITELNDPSDSDCLAHRI